MLRRVWGREMANLKRIMLVLGVVASAVAARPVISAEIKATPGKDARVVISIVGEIVPGDADTFIDVVKKANAAGRFVANVRLNSPGGNLLEGVRLADTIKTAKIATNVGQSAICASACFLVFAAGSEKNASLALKLVCTERQAMMARKQFNRVQPPCRWPALQKNWASRQPLSVAWSLRLQTRWFG